MEHNLHTLQKEFREKALTETERRALKARLAVFMHERPQVPQRLFSFTWASHSSIFRLTPVFIIALFFVGGGISRVAEDSIPGDILYGFKTGVNEEIKGFLATSPESSAALEVDLAERRLSELERMAVPSSPELIVQPASTPEASSAPASSVTSAPATSLMMVQTEARSTNQVEQPTPTPAPVIPTSKIEKSSKQKKKEAAALKLDTELQVHIERAEEKLQKIEALQGETEVVVKAREKLRKVNERRQKNKSVEVITEPATLIIGAPVEDTSTKVEDTGPKNKNSRRSKNAHTEGSTSVTPDEGVKPPEPAPMMMQIEVAPEASVVTPVLSCFGTSVQSTEAAYALVRIKDLKAYLASHADSLEKGYVEETEKKLSELEEGISKIKKFVGVSDPLTSTHKGLAALEFELVGMSCPER
jgi:hypothetical protein